MRILLAFFLISSSIATAQTDHGITFAVDDVELAKKPLSDSSFKLVFEDKVNREIFAYPTELEEYEYAITYMHGFVGAIHAAYDEHRPLALSPDDVWLTICQGFGIHLLVNSEELEEKVLKSGHPDKIVVREDDLKKDDEESWKRLIAGFHSEVDNYAKEDVIDLVSPTFSTTTPVITTAYQSTVLHSFKNYFRYMGESGCGIPNITLLGEKSDWQKIYDDIDQFKQYGLEEWVDELKPVLKEFLNAYEGSPDVEFWQSIYKNASWYGRSYITGWVLKFFPYFEYQEMEGESSWEHEVKFVTKYRANPYLKGNNYVLSTVSPGSLPKGYIELDFIWNEYLDSGLQKHDMKLFAGFFGIKQDTESLMVSPNIGWAICEGGPTDFEPSGLPRIRWSDREELKHPYLGFMPDIKDSVEQMPIYAKNISFDASRAEIKAFLIKNGVKSWDGAEINFIVGHNGKVVFESLSSDPLHQEEKIKQLLETLPYDWAAGRSLELNFLDVREEDRKPIPVNVRVRITL